MGSLGERNSKPTPSSSKNMWCKTHKHSPSEDNRRCIFTHAAWWKLHKCDVSKIVRGEWSTEIRNEKCLSKMTPTKLALRTQNTTWWSPSMLKSALALLLGLHSRSPSCYIRVSVSEHQSPLLPKICVEPDCLCSATLLIWATRINDREMVGYEHPQHHSIFPICHEDMS